MFNIVRFKNDPCTGSSRNGTCYTSEECNSRGGASAGTCAQGFGVCCVFTLSCGGTTTDNSTYIVQAPTTSTPVDGTGTCEYTICRCSDDICRIRFDFDSFSIAGPVEGTARNSGDAAIVTTDGGAIGDCETDSFSIAAPGNVGSPVICGFNDGQHSNFT